PGGLRGRRGNPAGHGLLQLPRAGDDTVRHRPDDRFEPGPAVLVWDPAAVLTSDFIAAGARGAGVEDCQGWGGGFGNLRPKCPQTSPANPAATREVAMTSVR